MIWLFTESVFAYHSEAREPGRLYVRLCRLLEQAQRAGRGGNLREAKLSGSRASAGIFEKRASEARQAEGKTPVVKWEPSRGHVGNLYSGCPSEAACPSMGLLVHQAMDHLCWIDHASPKRACLCLRQVPPCFIGYSDLAIDLLQVSERTKIGMKSRTKSFLPMSSLDQADSFYLIWYDMT